MESALPSTAASLNEFIRCYRARLDPSVRCLGSFARVSRRVGAPVSEAEFAEALGVSRQWYVTMERCPQIRVSSWMLARIAHVLMLDSQQREELYNLAAGSLDTSASA